MTRHVFAAGVSLALLLAPAPALAQEVQAPLALMVMLKVITYDANFAARGSGDFVVLVPYAPGQPTKAAATVELARGMELRSIKERKLRFLALPVAELTQTKAEAVLLHPGISGEVAREALQLAAAAGLYTLAFDEQLVRDGAMLGVASSEGRPQVLVNVTSARGIGADISGTVLKKAKTYQ